MTGKVGLGARSENVGELAFRVIRKQDPRVRPGSGSQAASKLFAERSPSGIRFFNFMEQRRRRFGTGTATDFRKALPEVIETSSLAVFFPNQFQNPVLHFVPNLPHTLKRQPFRVGKRPVVAAKSGNPGTLLAAPHGHEQTGIARQLFSEQLRLRLGQIESDLTHNLQDFGVNTRPRLRSGGKGPRFPRIGELIEKGGRHLRPPGIVNTSKDDCLHRRP